MAYVETFTTSIITGIFNITIVTVTTKISSPHYQMLLIDLWGRKPVFSLSLTFTGVALIVSAFIEVELVIIFVSHFYIVSACGCFFLQS